MKFNIWLGLNLIVIVPCLSLVVGCSHSSSVTSPYHPVPVAGKAVGAGVGVVVGNAAAGAVSVTEGVIVGASAPFDPTTRVVRRWRTETTSDGRTIQVPEDILVDAQGRPVKMPAPK